MRKSLTPCTTPSWHVRGVHDDKTAVVLILGGNAHTLPCVVDLRRRLYCHVKVSVLADIRKVRGLRVARAEVGDRAVRRVRASKEVPAIKEVISTLK
jgi:hypothetical protein